MIAFSLDHSSASQASDGIICLGLPYSLPTMTTTSPPRPDRIASTASQEKHALAVGLEKPIALHEEEYADEEGAGPAVDYSGARKKSDPKEIGLVRKLDKWILTTL